MKKRIGRLVAWLVTLGVFAYLFATVPAREVWRALVDRAPPWTVPVLGALVVVVYFADALAIQATFRWFLARLSFGEVLIVRGATYLLGLINYALGQGAIVFFMHRSRGTPILKGAGTVLLIMGTNLLLLLLLTSVGLLVAPEVPHALKTIVAVAYAGLTVYASLVMLRPRWLTSRPVFDVLLGAGLVGHVKALAVRVPHLCTLIVYTYVSLRAFGVDVPIGQAILYLPVVYFVAVLPISVQGWGATQGAIMFFFARYATGDNPRAVVLASSITAQAVALCVQAAIGLACMRHRLARDLAKAPTS
jgi:hypothetical protein